MIYSLHTYINLHYIALLCTYTCLYGTFGLLGIQGWPTCIFILKLDDEWSVQGLEHPLVSQFDEFHFLGVFWFRVFKHPLEKNIWHLNSDAVMFGWSQHVWMIVTWIILTGDSDNDCDFCNYVFVSEDCRTGCGPLLARVATRMITFLVYRGFQPKPSFATIASWGPQPTHYQSRTVDGRNLANQLTWYFIPFFTEFFYIPGGCFGFLPSLVSVQIQLLWLLQLSMFSTENLCLKTSDRGSGFFDANGAVWDRNTYCLRFDDAILEGYESQVASGNNGNNTNVWMSFSLFCSFCHV